jgi:hypothetical protein
MGAGAPRELVSTDDGTSPDCPSDPALSAPLVKVRPPGNVAYLPASILNEKPRPFGRGSSQFAFNPSPELLEKPPGAAESIV